MAYQTHDTLSADALLPEERESLQRAVPKRVHEFAAGRACARAALVQMGYGAVALPPGADRAPRWPEGATGSITHTDGFCAAVVARTVQIRALGLDAEPEDSVKPHLWRRICTPEELANLQAQNEAAALLTATLLFSAKEAFYKCQHTLTGQWLGFTDISIDFEAERFSVRATRSLQIAQHHPGPWHGRYLREQGLLITGFCIV
ncbi:MAG TPA: 4'-phosphopantetheinyl transferase superfamily protein [Steroidobacteraceae bacterium]|nr:4'-phosphopantetheinyl transferase superfamily protein [Steroidobacteraceae bacterium]